MNNLQQAAKQALEALEKCRDWPGAYDECSLALHNLRAALNLPEQEPVAFIEPAADNDCAYAYADGWNACVRAHKHSPTARKPLTDEAIMDMVRDMSIQMRWPSTPLEIARAIERAHGITGEQQ